MRPGRLDRILYVGPPDEDGRKEILRICTSRMSVQPDLDIDELARIVRLSDFIERHRLISYSRPMGVRERRSLRYVKKQRFSP